MHQSCSSMQSREQQALESLSDDADDYFEDPLNLSDKSFTELRSSIFSEIEVLRAKLEEALGFDNFARAYRGESEQVIHAWIVVESSCLIHSLAHACTQGDEGISATVGLGAEPAREFVLSVVGAERGKEVVGMLTELVTAESVHS